MNMCWSTLQVITFWRHLTLKAKLTASGRFVLQLNHTFVNKRRREASCSRVVRPSVC